MWKDHRQQRPRIRRRRVSVSSKVTRSAARRRRASIGKHAAKRDMDSPVLIGGAASRMEKS